MRSFILLSLCFSVLFTLPTSAQPGYYRIPMDIPALLAGNFAEMRSGHFHSGIDFKTQDKEGIEVRCAADGVLVRVAVSPEGFGRVLYIDHPNGTTTVYAHLQRFTPDIETFLADERYRQKKDGIDLVPPAGKFSFKKGELIGYSGNSGSSGGPHLHFEIRQTASQRVLNPIAQGYVTVKDDIAPTICRLYYIQVDTVTGVPLNAAPREIPITPLAPSRAVYAAVDTVIAVARNGYFVVEAIDRKNGTPNNTFGIYRTTQSVDGKINIEQLRDKFLFSDTRYVNAMAYYGLNKGNPHEVIRMAVMAGNKLPMYSKLKNRGAVVLEDTLLHEVSIEVEDDNKNISRVDLKIRRADFPLSALPSSPLIARHDKQFSYATADAGITIPAGALYEPVFYGQSVDPAGIIPGRLSPVHTFGSEDVPSHTYFTLWVAAEVPATLRGKATLARLDKNGALSYAGGTWSSASGAIPERVVAKLRDFGRYCVVVDTIAPKITPNFKPGADMTGKKSFSIRIEDEFSGIASFRATLDGQWALMEYDIKNKTLTHTFDPTRFNLKGLHTITLEVADKMGNKSNYKNSFSIK